MSKDLDLNDADLDAAARVIVDAAETALASIGVPLTPVDGLTDVGQRLREFVRGIDDGRLALGSDAYTTSESIVRVKSRASDLDARIAERLSGLAGSRGGM